MKVVMIAGHLAVAPRKVGFHFWSEYLTARGDEVYFITVGQSHLSLLTKKSRPPEPYNCWVALRDHLYGMVWVPPFNPCLNKPLINPFLLPVFSLYPRFFPRAALNDIQDADYIVVESGPGLALVPGLAKACPKAKIIYQVSDRLVTVGAHPAIIAAEKKALPYCSFIRVPAAVMLKDFPPNSPILYMPQGLNKPDFEARFPSPYSKDNNVISIGDMLFDADAIAIMAEAFPDWTFHVFGRNAKMNKPFANVIEYGERPIGELTAYIQHADIGLAPYRDAPNCEYLSQSSLKMIQYTYCQLPIVGPAFAGDGRAHVLTYESNKNPGGIIAAFRQAIDYDRSSISKAKVMAWGEIFENMLENANRSTKTAAA